MNIDDFMEWVVRRSDAEPEFHQAVREFAEKVIPFVDENPKYKKPRILERMTEPDRVIMFRVSWESDDGVFHVNRGYRVQFNNAIGPYKGGLRFDPSVNLSVLKFLGFEQCFKNSLTTLPMGGGKGGADFDPKGRSDHEIMRFCQSFMSGLFRYIGEDVDVPAGDIGVGAREIGYLFGQYKRLRNEFTGAITGKGTAYGGSRLRPEATGYGCVYFANEMLKAQEDGLEGKTCVVSGSGNVAQYAAEKLIEMGAKVVTLSDRTGFIYEPDGFTKERLDWVIDLKTNRHGTLEEYAKEFGSEYHVDEKVWGVSCDLAFPCATQNSGVMLAPGKAANAGGVAISGLEMTQNAIRMSWTREEIDQRLQKIMRGIHEQCVEYGQDNGRIDYVKGANVAGFIKVADAMLAYGVV
jgi:glutamate dehydrogenase (NADP+)